MNKQLSVRPSNVNDCEMVYRLLRGIADLHRNGRPEIFHDLTSKYSVEQLKERLSREDNGIFIGMLDGVPVGYVFCDIIKEGNGLTLYVDDLCVDESARGNGVATALMDFASAYGKEKDCRFLMLNVWEFNETAVKFYEKYGLTTRSRHLEKTL